MTHIARTIATLVFGGSLLFAQLPNPLNLPDPLGITKRPTRTAPAPRVLGAPREGRRTERRPERDVYRNRGRHRGHDKYKDYDRGERRRHDNR